MTKQELSMPALVTLRTEDWVCIADSDEVPEGRQLVLMRFSDGEFESCYTHEGLFDGSWMGVPPTHWMPLPTPGIPNGIIRMHINIRKTGEPDD